MKSNKAVQLDVSVTGYHTVYNAVDMDVSGAVSRAVNWAVRRVVDAAVSGAVYRSVDGDTARTARHGPPHPSLDDFLAHASAEAP